MNTTINTKFNLSLVYSEAFLLHFFIIIVPFPQSQSQNVSHTNSLIYKLLGAYSSILSCLICSEPTVPGLFISRAGLISSSWDSERFELFSICSDWQVILIGHSCYKQALSFLPDAFGPSRSVLYVCFTPECFPFLPRLVLKYRA